MRVYSSGCYEPAVLAAYGVVLSFISIPILMMSGFTIAVLCAGRRHVEGKLPEFTAVALMGSLFFFSFLVLIGTILNVFEFGDPVTRAHANTYFWMRFLSLPLLPSNGLSL